MVNSLEPYPNIQLVTRSTKPVMKTVFHGRSYGRFIQAPSNLRRKKLREQIKAPIFLDAALKKRKNCNSTNAV